MTTSSLTSPAPGRYRSDLILYLAIAFALSWACWFTAAGLGGSATSPPAAAPYVLGAFGPAIAALVVRIRRRWRGEPAPANAVPFRRATLPWAPLLLVLASATVLVAAVIAHAAGGPGFSAQDAKDAIDKANGPAAFLFGILVTGPLSEEPGWRGTAYPRMRASMGRFHAGLTLGVIWAVWHLPLFLITGSQQHKLGLTSPNGVLFTVSVVPMALLTGYAYERAGIVASMAVHFATNLTMVLLNVTAPVTLAMIIGIQGIVAVVLLATARFPAAQPAAPAPATVLPAGAQPDTSTWAH
ncbi:lysostaphin resistance A-like protein [Actinoallomurus sp. CA-150999]|uniref:CPBP family intramembrane glutamic endopeptidase n=1 Tax=Actinoallomurus sp. CA-150999 TaxID=3239887 RepID=UPI003D92024A